MALSDCNVTIDQSNKELVQHGQTMFPIACYDDNLSAMSVPWHWHDDFEFIIMTEGVAHVQIENRTLSLHKGDAVFINTAILHSIDRATIGHSRCHSLVFHARLIGGSIDSIFWQKLITPIIQDKFFRYLSLDHTIDWQVEIINLFATAWNAVAKETDDYENDVRYYLSKAFRLLNAHRQTTNTISSKQEQRNAERLKIMIQYIEDNYANELSLHMIAASANISESACLRCFRQVIDSTPIRYLMQYRIEKASDLLKYSNEYSNEIAILCGFSDISYFSKCFRETKGCTPLEFRKTFRQKNSSIHSPTTYAPHTIQK